jgi:transcriptional regulator with XRE-family HTH domain
MAGHRPWREIRRPRTAEDDARITAAARTMLLISDLTALRETRELTQSALAASVGVSQARISQIEHQDDLTLSTLEEFVRGLGGELRISVVFPDETVELTGRR